jgi:hypothetical protein
MNVTTTYAHHFFAKGCELAGCDAPDRRCDLYLLEGERAPNSDASEWGTQRRAVRACCGDHAQACADLETWLAMHQPDLGREYVPEEEGR